MIWNSMKLAAHPRIAHGFFGRQGGVSGGLYASLNCGLGSGDSQVDVLENRRRVADTLGDAKTLLCTLYQVHGNNIVRVKTAWDNDTRPEGDALVTNRPGIALGILTADCVPVLFSDMQNTVIGATHAGWKGAIGGVLEATIAAMKSLGAGRDTIAAAIGPCIKQPSYEVGPEFYGHFMQENAHNVDFFIPSLRPGHHYFDLSAYVRLRLMRAGIEQIDTLPHDTYAEEGRFFSFRRATLRGERDYGRQVSAVMIR